MCSINTDGQQMKFSKKLVKILDRKNELEDEAG